MTDQVTMDIQKILSLLPHRYPFLLVDRVIECTPGESLVGFKNLTINEPYFQGHFPGQPVMPGVIIIEALAQAAGLLAFATVGEGAEHHSTFYFVGIDKARFRRPVVPGDRLLLKVRMTRRIRDIWKFDVAAEVNGSRVAEAEIMVAPKGAG